MSAGQELTLHIHQAQADLPEGLKLRTTGGARACLQRHEAGATVHLALPECSTAEVRWIVDRVVRKVREVADLHACRLEVASDIDSELALALALDLHNRTHGRLTVPASLQTKLEAIAPYEDGYRAWVNEDPQLRTSIAIADDVTEWASQRAEVECHVLTEPELETKGLRLLLAVGQGAVVSPPRLVIANYKPEGKRSAPTMLLGKGITFDTGGINVKPYESFVSTMKNDMGGAALAFWLFRALVEAKHPEPLALVIPTCENAVGSNAMKPGALVTGYAGKTVRIDHTDAEGRLVLADGLAYGCEKLAPRKVLCFATLTTSALVSYGPFATPVHFADRELAEKLQESSERTGEDLHFFPERIWHYEANRDREADVKNTARLPGQAVRGAGSRNAAHFLRHFSDTPLVHFDIFGSTWNWSGEAPGSGYGATGAPLRTLLNALRR